VEAELRGRRGIRGSFSYVHEKIKGEEKKMEKKVIGGAKVPVFPGFPGGRHGS
jgi:hypothetical protein